MVVRANRVDHSIGGHISTYASAATLFEVGLQPFLPRTHRGIRGRHRLSAGTCISRRLCARVSGRPSVRRSSWKTSAANSETGGGLSSYPHPWLMPDFWEYPDGVDGPRTAHGHLPGPLQPVSRRPRPETGHRCKVWAFLGDGETDEPEGWAASPWLPAKISTISFSSSIATCSAWTARCAAMEKSSRNWKPLSGAPAGIVIKVLWGSDWDPLFERDTEGPAGQAPGRNGGRRICRSCPSNQAPMFASMYLVPIPGC